MVRKQGNVMEIMAADSLHDWRALHWRLETLSVPGKPSGEKFSSPHPNDNTFLRHAVGWSTGICL